MKKASGTSWLNVCKLCLCSVSVSLASFAVMLVLALASPQFLGDGLLAALAMVRQRELTYQRKRFSLDPSAFLNLV
jgi:hypothetical protein